MNEKKPSMSRGATDLLKQYGDRTATMICRQMVKNHRNNHPHNPTASGVTFTESDVRKAAEEVNAHRLNLFKGCL